MSDSTDQQHDGLTYQQFIAIEEMPEFNHFVRRKNIFLFSVTGSFLFIYILLPILAFQPFLQTPVVGAITGVWFYSAGLFLMTIVLCTLYVRKASQFDRESAAVLQKFEEMKGGQP
ncbi:MULTISPECIES: DUF485 domain-containing protein [Wohlfahrtiimonas]|uniref:DUF485 domain-containing protein n=1 Tax=Wohlfahrtiimonas TaxID=582472 RepID=UPI00037AF08B|nr:MULTISPECIES: DUF485 domain-containing protein [Wohlfahrtiimonas]OYQ72901.1 hypothetical protein B9T20_08155 [Wohlfahrtiimonas sp. G9077]